MLNNVPECGDETSHNFHSFVDMHFKTRWCSGLCDCSLRREAHGPGAHK